MNDDDYCSVFEFIVNPVLDEFAPDIIIGNNYNDNFNQC